MRSNMYYVAAFRVRHSLRVGYMLNLAPASPVKLKTRQRYDIQQDIYSPTATNTLRYTI